MDELVLVTGGTGTLGQALVPLLQGTGRQVRTFSRNASESSMGVQHVTGDLQTGANIDAAVQGATVIVHCAGTSKGDEVKAAKLVQAASRSGSPHLVFISVIGCDRVPVKSAVDRAMFGYFASKLAAERMIAESGLPWTTLRASQFHDLIFMTARQMSRLPVVPVPRTRFQPIDTEEVAARLVELALGNPAGLVPEMAGPRVYEMADLLRSYLRAFGRHRLLLRVRVPGGAARAVREGANLAPQHAVGRRSWEQFLADKTNGGWRAGAMT